MPVNTIIQGDSLEVLKTFESESVDCVITSPPYFALRSYLPKDHPDKKKEIGSENSMQEHIEVLMKIFKELKRVLKPSGSFWLNYGDSYGTGSGAGSREGTKQATNKGSNYYEEEGKPQQIGFEKSLLMLPERIALALIDDGWILRQKICWAKQVYFHKDKMTKGSAVPTSVKVRFNTTFEYLYHFSKNNSGSEWYHYGNEPNKEKFPQKWRVWNTLPEIFRTHCWQKKDIPQKFLWAFMNLDYYF